MTPRDPAFHDRSGVRTGRPDQRHPITFTVVFSEPVLGFGDDRWTSRDRQPEQRERL
jgi:hypothetical protein